MRASANDPQPRRDRLLIGVPSFRRPDGLRRLLQSLAGQRDVEHESIEIFVADNDPARQEAQAVCLSLADAFRWPLSAAVVAEPGISAARNAILDQARARNATLVAMIDDDEEAEPNWLCRLLEMQRRTGADVVGGPVDYDLPSFVRSQIRHCGAFHPRSWPEGELPLIDGCGNVLLSCGGLARLGWPRFDDAFGTTGGEDKEFFTRLQRTGATFAWAPTARAREHVPPDRARLEWVVRRSYRIGNNDMRITRLHDSRRTTAISIGKTLLLLATAPLAAPILLLPSRQLWILRKWARAVGKLNALRGREYHEYGRQLPVIASGPRETARDGGQT